MNNEQKIWPLIEALRESLVLEAYSGEIGLLLAWKRLVETKPELSLPTPKDVIDGVISFKEACSKISEILGDLGGDYKRKYSLDF